jgi:hypothetical protein
MKKNKTNRDDHAMKRPFVYGDPDYGPQDDIYSNQTKVVLREEGDEFDTDDATQEIQVPGQDLDIPGSELDDADEKIGGEDEENNYYSLGGDNHDDLEEDKT